MHRWPIPWIKGFSQSDKGLLSSWFRLCFYSFESLTLKFSSSAFKCQLPNFMFECISYFHWSKRDFKNLKNKSPEAAISVYNVLLTTLWQPFSDTKDCQFNTRTAFMIMTLYSNQFSRIRVAFEFPALILFKSSPLAFQRSNVNLNITNLTNFSWNARGNLRNFNI